MKPLYILDGYGIIFRSYFAFIRAPRRAPDGKNVSAVFGFFRTLLSLMKEYQPEYFVVALDSRTPTFRDEMYSDYKQNRDETPQDLKDQFPVIEQAISAFGLPHIRVDGFEADDLMATLARQAREEHRSCYIISSDKDLMQLVQGEVQMLRPTTKDGLITMDRQAVYDEKGVWPEQIIDFLSLVGDTADNVPGVKGIGEKTAAKLLGDYETLDGIYQALDRGEISAKGTAAKLQDGRDAAYLSKKLVILADAVGLPENAGDFHLGRLNAGALAELLLPLGMRSLLKDIGVVTGQDLSNFEQSFSQEGGQGVLGGSVQGDGNPSATEVFAQAKADHPGVSSADPGNPAKDTKPSEPEGGESSAGGPDEESAWNPDWIAPADVPGGIDSPEIQSLARDLAGRESSYELLTELSELDRWIELLRQAGEFAFDCETTGLDSLQAEPLGFSFSHEPGKACYIPLEGPQGTVLPPEEVRSRLKALLEDPAMRIVGQNIKYDMKVLDRWGIRFTPYFDTMVAAWVLESASNRFNMDDLAQQYFGYTTIHYKDLLESAGLKKDTPFSQVPLDQASTYAAEDADITLRLFRLFKRLLELRHLDHLFFSLEMPLLPILSRMEQEGIGLDVQALQNFSQELGNRLEDIQGEIFELVGHEFNINSTKQLQTVLFEERKLQPIKKTKTGYSTDTSVLEELAQEDPVPQRILQYRGLTKLKSTYVDTLPQLIHPESGRIHTHFLQHGTATGRISSKDPNLQNIPIKDEEGRKIRQAFVAKPGHIFVSADYSQIELVVLAHMAKDPGLIQAFTEGVDVHRATGSLIFGVPADQVSLDQRRIAKTINFGVMYGMSAFRLSRELGIPRKEADHFIKTYFKTYRGISRFIQDQSDLARHYGGVFTLSGRFRRIPEIRSKNKAELAGAERIAVNTPIQGSAADIVKTAMLKVERNLKDRGLKSRLILQVHDELILECPRDEEQAVRDMLLQTMPKALALDVPLQVSVESGTRWGDMH